MSLMLWNLLREYLVAFRNMSDSGRISGMVEAVVKRLRGMCGGMLGGWLHFFFWGVGLWVGWFMRMSREV